jgi:UDP-2,3-diacylglucosamine pyrophosphatase LpxH
MLAIVSDLHLTDGSTAMNPHGSALELMEREVVSTAADPKKGIEQIEVLLLGDIMDFVRTDYWQGVPKKERPWNGKLARATGMNEDDARNERHFMTVLDRILEQDCAKTLVRVVQGLSERTNTSVSVRYVIGNHDRVLHNYPSLQRTIAARFAPVPVTFETQLIDHRYAIAARHGHEWDPHCHGWQFAKVLQGRTVNRFDQEAYKVMAIGEVVTAELMSGLVHRAQNALDPKDPEDQAFLKALKDVNNLRPMTDVIQWITWLTQTESQRYIKLAESAFREALADALDSDLAKQWDKVKPDFIVSGDLTDYLAKARWVLERDEGLHKLQQIIDVVEGAQNALTRVLGERDRDELVLGAFEEFKESLPAETQYVVYGHTHSARQDYFSATLDHKVRMYINTGTFMPLITKAYDKRSFARSSRLSFVCFFHKDEDQNDRLGDGPTLEVWDGVKRKEYATS